MKIRKNLAVQFFLLFFSVVSIFFVAGFLISKKIPFLKIGKIPTIIFGVLLFLIFLIVFFIFLKKIFIPIRTIILQIEALLSGKKYKRISEKKNDNEIGTIGKFFNEITRNLESISTDLVAQKQLNNELSLASQIQKDILPKSAPRITGLDVVAKTRSAAEVGGDSFDFIEIDDGVLIYIGDVTGHGIPAGLIMTMANTLMHSFAKIHRDPKELLVKTNQMLHHRISSKHFMTMVLLRWNRNEKKLSFLGAGHEHILIYRAKTREVEVVRSGGIALRMVPDVSEIIKEENLHLDENDVVLLYTDGIDEAKNEDGEMFTFQRLKSVFQKHGHRSSAENIFDSITEEFSNFIGQAPQNDDITMIVLRKLPKDEHGSEKGVKLTVNVNKTSGSNSQKWCWE